MAAITQSSNLGPSFHLREAVQETILNDKDLQIQIFYRNILKTTIALALGALSGVALFFVCAKVITLSDTIALLYSYGVLGGVLYFINKNDRFLRKNFSEFEELAEGLKESLAERKQLIEQGLESMHVGVSLASKAIEPVEQTFQTRERNLKAEPSSQATNKEQVQALFSRVQAMLQKCARTNEERAELHSEWVKEVPNLLSLIDRYSKLFTGYKSHVTTIRHLVTLEKARVCIKECYRIWDNLLASIQDHAPDFERVDEMVTNTLATANNNLQLRNENHDLRSEAANE